jgi:rare lipoprotein A
MQPVLANLCYQDTVDLNAAITEGLADHRQSMPSRSNAYFLTPPRTHLVTIHSDHLILFLLPLGSRNLIRLVYISFLFTALSLASCAKPTTINQAEWIGYQESGKASYYAMKYQNRKTASGERLNQGSKTAAHRKLPFGTIVKVTNIENSKSVMVKINDRGPFVKGRIIDLTRSAFKSIGDLDLGVINVKIEVKK